MEKMYQDDIKECNSLQEIFNTVKSIYKRRNNKNNHNFYFRGQSNANWNLNSSLKRDKKLIQSYSKANDKEKIEIVVKEIEKEINTYNNFISDYCDDIRFIEGCQKIIKDNRLKLKIIDIPTTVELKEDISVVALMQHYGIKTRALDFTEQLMVALFFAVNKAKDDAALWVLDKHMMNTILYNQNKSEFKDFPVDDAVPMKQKYVEYLNHDLEYYKKKLQRKTNNDDGQCYCVPDDFEKLIISAKDKAEELKEIGYEAYGTYASSLHANLFNQRLQRQSGVFVLQSYKPIDIQEEYDKLIDDIKRGHFEAKGKRFDRDKIYSPFTKIVIKRKCLQEIRDFLNIVGITAESLGLMKLF